VEQLVAVRQGGRERVLRIFRGGQWGFSVYRMLVRRLWRFWGVRATPAEESRSGDAASSGSSGDIGKPIDKLKGDDSVDPVEVAAVLGDQRDPGLAAGKRQQDVIAK
jgi:hypothetical protein